MQSGGYQHDSEQYAECFFIWRKIVEKVFETFESFDPFMSFYLLEVCHRLQYHQHPEFFPFLIPSVFEILFRVGKQAFGRIGHIYLPFFCFIHNNEVVLVPVYDTWQWNPVSQILHSRLNRYSS